ncbi:hypothetical protein L7F22_021410 [Adiantum nelumboides]|nr:hypothetical protein [Adiantum nelumboides]
MASGEGQLNPSTSVDAGGDHNEDYGNEYGLPLPTQEELREHRRLVGEATNLMLNFTKDPKLTKYMTETAFQDVHAQWKATTTSPLKPDSKKQYSEKELEEEWKESFGEDKQLRTVHLCASSKAAYLYHVPLRSKGEVKHVSSARTCLTVCSGATNGAATSSSSENSNNLVSVESGLSRVAFLGNLSSHEKVDAVEAGLEILTATITQQTEQFFVSETDGDPDQPSESFTSVAEAVDAIRNGKVSVV